MTKTKTLGDLAFGELAYTMDWQIFKYWGKWYIYKHMACSPAPLAAWRLKVSRKDVDTLYVYSFTPKEPELKEGVHIITQRPRTPVDCPSFLLEFI